MAACAAASALAVRGQAPLPPPARLRPCAPLTAHWAAARHCRRRGVPVAAAADGGAGSASGDDSSASSGGSGSGEGGGPEESAEAAAAAAATVVQLFLAERLQPSDLDSVVAFLPDTVIDRLLERKRRKLEDEASAAPSGSGTPATAAAAAAAAAADADTDDLAFTELVSLAQPSDLALDAYAARGLLNARPRSAALLSSLKLAPGRFLQRYNVMAQSGEEMVLTIEMGLEESLQPKYRGLSVVKRWFLRGITGEPAYPGEVPSKPEPCWGPEAVCMAQLEALAASDAARVFRFASPANQAATGPSVDRFAEMLGAPQYRPLLGHLGAEVLRSVQMKPDVALLIVGVTSNLPTSEPGVTQRAVYSWTVRLQGAADAAGAPTPQELINCWMTEGVQPISQNLFGGFGGNT